MKGSGKKVIADNRRARHEYSIEDDYEAGMVLGLGIDELSLNPPFIPEIKNIIRSLSYQDTRAFVDEAVRLSTADQVYSLVQTRYGHLFKMDNI